MLISEAIEKEYMILVINEETAKRLRKQFKYQLIKSYRTKTLDACKGYLIDDACDVTKMSIDVDGLENVNYGSVLKNEYLDVLKTCEALIASQGETIKAGIALRIFVAHIQKYLQDLEDAGNNLGLQETIDTLISLSKEFDLLAMETGPYQKEAYISNVLVPFLGGEDNETA